MTDPEGARVFENLGRQLNNAISIVGTNNISQVVPNFDGDPKQFKFWIKGIEKYGTLTGEDPNRLKLVAYLTSKNSVSDFICRYLKENPRESWAELKNELSSRFAEIHDSQHAFCLLRSIKQNKGENVQLYAERLLALAEEAFEGQDGDMRLIERQLIGFFIDGLTHDFLKIKVMRDNPETLQDAVRSAMNEQNLRSRFNLRIGKSNENSHMTLNRHEPMEIDHLRIRNCSYCKKPKNQDIIFQNVEENQNLFGL